MNEEQLSNDIRKLLKRFGVTAQREIESAVRAGLHSGRLRGTEILQARATLTVDGLDVHLAIEDDLRLS